MNQTPAHIKLGVIETNPELIDVTVCLKSTGFPVLAFSVNREDLIARLQQCPVSTVAEVEQLNLRMQVPETREKPLDATLFA